MRTSTRRATTISLTLASIGGALLSGGNAGAAVPAPPLGLPPVPPNTPLTSLATANPVPNKVTFSYKSGPMNADGTKGAATTNLSVTKAYTPGVKVSFQQADPNIPVTSAGTTGQIPGTPSWEGCGWIENGTYLDSDIFRVRLFEYSVSTRWCWGFNSGAREVRSTDGPGTDPKYAENPRPTNTFWGTGPLLVDQHFFYAPWTKNGQPVPRSGHQDFMVRKFEQSCAGVGSCPGREAWVRNIVFADGGYWWDAGVN